MPSSLVPWLVLPHNKNYKNLRFFDLSSGKVHRFKLPNRLRGGVCCASSKGWLLVAKQEAQQSQQSLGLIKKLIYGSRQIISQIFHLLSLILSFLESSIPIPDTDQLFLFNPLSGALHELPSLSTFPGYHAFMRARPIVADFIHSFQLSSPDPSESMVIALVIRHPQVRYGVALALCRLGDKGWSIVHYEGIDDVVGCRDILFRNGTLYVLSSFRSMDSVKHHNFQLGDSAVSIKVVPDRRGKVFGPLQRIKRSHLPGIAALPGYFLLYLLESVGGELLLISKDVDAYFRAEHESDFDLLNVVLTQEGRRKYPYRKTVGFTVFRLDPDTGRVDRIENLSDQAIFLGFGEAVSVAASNLPHGIEGNCIFFAEDLNYIFDYQNQTPIVSRESGVYCIGTGKITRSLPSVQIPTASNLCWFIPPNNSNCEHLKYSGYLPFSFSPFVLLGLYLFICILALVCTKHIIVQ